VSYKKERLFMNICIVGTGYVGLVTAACFAEMGNDVYCIDVDPTIIDGLKSGKNSYL
jgi:UDPglucose 6-dehydrogenase